MIKQFFILIPILFLSACAQTMPMSKNSMQCGMMSNECSCCQKMMKNGAMDMGMMKDGKMQCKMMEGTQNSSKPVTASDKGMTEAEHAKHHPSK